MRKLYAARPDCRPLHPERGEVRADAIPNRKEVERYLAALEPRERVIAHLAIFAAMRPGEILGFQRRHIGAGCRSAVIDQRLYRGDIDWPKTMSSRRTAAIPPKTASLLKEWMELVGDSPNAWVFTSENPATPVWRDNVWYRYMKLRLKPLGFGWANFQALRRTHASLGPRSRDRLQGVGRPARARHRGRAGYYTKAALSKRAEAAEWLEKAVLTA